MALLLRYERNVFGANRRDGRCQILAGAEAHVTQKRGGYRRHLLAIGGAKDGDTGLVEGAFSANLRIELVEQLSNEHAVLAVRVIGDLARRIRRDDERVVGRVDWRKPMRVGAET